MPNVHIRPITSADLPTIATIHIEGWQTAYSTFLPAEFLSSLSQEKNIARFQRWIFESDQPLVALIACVDDRPAGFLLAGPAEDKPADGDAEVYKLFVRPAYQGLGIGRALLHKAAAALVEQGYTTVVIWVFEKARSAHFYEKLGGRHIGSMPETFGGQETWAVAFGWSLVDLRRRTGP